jgi:hypothetical protein
MGTKASARQFLVKVDGVEGYWATKSGGNVTAESQKVYDGGSLKPDIITNPPTAEDVTVTRPYDTARDPDILTALLQLVGSWETTVSVTPTDANLVAVGSPRVYPGARLIGVQDPEVDASSGDPSVCGLVFAIPDYR